MIPYDIVLCTRNRKQALSISVPSFIQQKYLPERIIVVDASDDHASIKKLLLHLLRDFPGELITLHSQPNSALQRNIGIEYVVSEIVVFPDDDSIWFSDTIEKILEIYALDDHGVIGGVCGAESSFPPPELNLSNVSKYRMKAYDKLLQKAGGLRYQIEDCFFTDPFKILGRSLWEGKTLSKTLQNQNVVQVEWMTGFRMSFRTVDIKMTQFNPLLGKYIGWAAGEDADACFRIMKNKVLAGARNAKIFHHKFPSYRANGFSFGFVTALNRIFIVCANSPIGSPARKALARYLSYKLMLYVFGALKSKYGRQRLAGAYYAMKQLRPMISAQGTELTQLYLDQWKSLKSKL